VKREWSTQRLKQEGVQKMCPIEQELVGPSNARSGLAGSQRVCCWVHSQRPMFSRFPWNLPLRPLWPCPPPQTHLIVGLDRDLALNRLPLADGQRLPEVEHRLLPVRVLRERARRELHRLVQLRARRDDTKRGQRSPTPGQNKSTDASSPESLEWVPIGAPPQHT